MRRLKKREKLKVEMERIQKLSVLMQSVKFPYSADHARLALSPSNAIDPQGNVSVMQAFTKTCLRQAAVDS